MRLRHLLLISCIFIAANISAQNKKKATATPVTETVPRPKLVVGIVIDQMRWDYLYRYYERYGQGGFKRLLNEGFRCENTTINYLPSATAVGHSSIFTGSVPAIHGIAGNDWVDQLTGKAAYCVSDSTVNSVGTASEEGKMSPRNLLASTITDELMLATNFRSKVVGVSLKDRASILPAGHSPTGAFWFDDATGRFITSTYYMQQLPAWVNNFNNANEPEKLTANDWNPLYPIPTYIQSSADNSIWEGKFAGETNTAFPHKIAELYKNRHVTIRSTPFGNTLTLDFAKAAIDAYKLGNNGTTDFLTINCASTDYVGHMFGLNAIETEDTYLRLDKDLAAFFSNLDAKVGKGNYLVFLTADHGATHSVEFAKAHNQPGGYWKQVDYKNKLNQMLEKKFKADNLVLSVIEYAVNFNVPKIEGQKLDYQAIKAVTVDFMKRDPNNLFAADMDKINDAAIPEIVRTKMINGYHYKRSGAVIVIPNAGYLQAGPTGTGHGEWNPDDTHIPLIFMGWNIKPGASYSDLHTTDIAPTVAALLHIQTPNGAIGQPITDLLKN
ncbi:alkaline phosphatase PafA [Mucilaginibacter boryungensis]|uniref:Alkaline phosphatase family protein n=1 Tax=Mucilaginibacter boryungensis TaxID=768480 RepID=A0ABR9XNA5_9SPHI|nr:alkaline phosphatase PafA [Mucilaginibacter boryungensis]MBE9668428.1 alkaline phosphatase family protein [Mucilaginibacter boryungensis]